MTVYDSACWPINDQVTVVAIHTDLGGDTPRESVIVVRGRAIDPSFSFPLGVHMGVSIVGIHVPADIDRPLDAVEYDAGDLALVRGVACGNAEAIALSIPRGTIYANEDGGRLRLPINRRASMLVAASTPSRRGTVVLGNALLVGPADEEGRDTSAERDYRAVLLDETDEYRVELVSAQDTPWWQSIGSRWRGPFAAYREGLKVAAVFPEMAVRVVPA